MPTVTAIRFILGDQLSPGLSSLRDAERASDIVVMAEVLEEATYVRHHKQKLVFVFSAMRHFAEDLRRDGFRVEYHRLDDPDGPASITAAIDEAVRRHKADRVVITEPGEWRLLEALMTFRDELPVPLEIREDNRFIASHADFERWAEGRKALRMEFFYREMRRFTGYLMEGDQPAGGQWNFDPDNRKKLPVGETLVPRLRFPPDAVTRSVMDLVGARFADHFGDLDTFRWGVTRTDALAALRHFVDDCLPRFGDYQDAMRQGADWLFHGLLSPYLNIGLLDPREACEAAIARWRSGHAPLNAVEGFVRQIIGWREYVRGIYWREMPDYAASNALEAKRRLPPFYWTGETDMACLAETIGATRRNAYAHHIQRLMVTGNFALLLGVEPKQVEEWYLLVYLDAYEWVELPNVHGMVLFADGGLLASKPYAASGAYIDRMSDYCRGCRYDPAVKTGPTACPFNPLYWNFLIENEGRLAGNPRMAMPYRTLAAMAPARRAQIVEDAQRILEIHG